MNTLISEVTKNKSLVVVGMNLFTQGGELCEVIEINGDNMKVRFEDDLIGEFDSWFDMNQLQLGWSFLEKDKAFMN